MKRLTLFIHLFFAVGAVTMAHGEYFSDKIQKSLLWIFQNGISNYYKGIDPDFIRKELYLTTGAGMPTIINENSTKNFEVLGFRINEFDSVLRRTKFYDVVRLFLYSDNKVFEYWVVKKYDGSGRCEGYFFIITSAESLMSGRMIEIISDQYIKEIEVRGTTIKFPEDNLFMVYILSPWRWPKSFINSELKNYIVKFRVNDIPYLRKIGWLERKYLNWYYAIPE